MKRRVLLGFVDVLLLMVLALVVLLVPPTPEAESKPPGNLAAEIRWPDGMDADVDLWLKSPDDKPVGYSRRAGKTWNLLRDDLGMVRDHLLLNFETGFSRGIPDGEYIVNVHLYSSRHGIEPVPVDVAIILSSPGISGMTILKTSVTIYNIGQEITVTRFTIRDGRVLPESFHDLQIGLR